ncbi:MAG: hypothetical protein JW720_11015 [Sedimentisphaerales bacterium]|nr:hypothetical protein [Sedimentisphaerales bacterium]
MAISALHNDLVTYYQNRHYLKQAENLTLRLESLNSDYDALLVRLEEDPNLIKRLAPAAIGAEHTEPNTVHPRATSRDLAEAKKALAELSRAEPNEPVLPMWLQRCGQGRRRMSLFAVGAALVLLCFVCFAPRKAPDEKT